MENYQKKFEVNKSAQTVYAALTDHVADWWSDDLTGSAMRLGDQFDIAFGQTRKTMEIVEAKCSQQIVWKCVKAHIDLASLKNKSEWVGTTMIWTLETDGQRTILHFLHEGLNRNFECYQVCEAGWDAFLASLQTYLNTGKGKPFLKAMLQKDSGI